MSGLTRWQRADSTVWPTFGRLFGLRHELDRLFESPLREWASSSRLLNVWNPAIDLYNDKDKVVVKVELPGMKQEGIEVSLDDGVLNISGERKSEEKFEQAQTHRTERFVGRFHRTITLPANVKNDQVTAQYKDGVLTVTLPKAEVAKPKKIEVTINK